MNILLRQPTGQRQGEYMLVSLKLREMQIAGTHTYIKMPNKCDVHYCNTYRLEVSIPGIQNYKDFWLKINTPKGNY